MSRTIVVTGAASGIGKATKELLQSRGDRVIGVDLHGSDIDCDLASEDGRRMLADAVAQASGGVVHGVIACAGLNHPVPATVAVNYFGMVASIEALRPLLAANDNPRAVGIASTSTLHPTDDDLVALLTAGDEMGALRRAEELAAGEETGYLIYTSTKKAFAQWIRRTAVTTLWAHAGIPLNAIAPGVIVTPMTEEMLTREDGSRIESMDAVPMPLGGFAEPIVPAYLLAWLVSEENTHLCGQVIFVDGGGDAVLRGDSVW